MGDPVRYTPIFCFHSVVENVAPGDGFGYPAAGFERLLDWFSRREYRTMTLDEYSASPRFSPKRVIFTFDDGYSNFNTVVSPLLEKHGFGATLYTYPGFHVGDERSSGAAGGPHALFTKEEFVEAASRPGVEVGAHGLSHENFTELDAEELDAELAESKKILEDLTGREIRTVAYPRGRFNSRCVKAVVKAGYSTAVSGDSSDGSLFSIPRIAPPLPFSEGKTLFKASGLSPFARKIRTKNT